MSFFRSASAFLLASLLGLGTTVAQAASISPASINVELVANQTITLERTVTLDATGPAANRVDVVFLADNTGSMGGAINTFRNNAQQILNAISGADPRFVGIDVQFGVASYNGDPREFGGTPQARALNAYRLHQAVTDSRDAVNTALSQWRASGGGDGPEANFFALHQVATSGGMTDGVGSTDQGYSTGYTTGWRPGAARVVVWFGDVSSHTTTVDINEAIAALRDNNVIVAAINSRGTNSGIDTSRQASTIVAEVGGSLTNNVQGTQTTVDAILNAVEGATGIVDLSLAARGDTSGLDIEFSCASPEGCTAVSPGDSRRFSMQIRGLQLGDYSFETYAPQLTGAVANDVVRVRECVADVNAYAKRDKVELIWGDSGADHYAVFRSEGNNGNYQQVGTTTSRYSVYVDRGLATGVTYYYQIREMDAAGNVLCSSMEVSATTTTRGRADTTPINLPPTITSTASASGLEDNLYSYDISATDPNGDAITYALIQGPAGMALSGNRIEWTPQNHQVGDSTVIVRAQDTAGLFDDQVFTITIANTNDAPQILSSAPTTARAEQLYQYSVNAVDVDAGDSLSFSLTTSPDGMQIDTASGVITWTPVFMQRGDHSVVVRVTDLDGAFDEQSFTIAVDALNNPPIITSTPLASINAGADYAYQLEVSDPNPGDVQHFILLEGPIGLMLNENTGLLSWSSAVAGVYTVSVQVADYAGLTDTQTFELTVVAPNSAPLFSSTPVTSASENVQYQYLAAANDADGDTLTYSLLASPAGMTINGDTGAILWTPAFADVGEQAVTVQVSDGEAQAQQSFVIVVTARANVAPVITSVPATNVVTGEAYSYQIVADDGDNDPLSFTLLQTAPGMSLSNAGLLTWTAGAVGSYNIEISVSDDRGAETRQSFTLAVNEPPNNAPVISSTPSTSVMVGEAYSYTIVASDSDNDPLQYALLQAPAGMTLSSNSLQWTPNAPQLGAHAVQIRVSDDRGGEATQSFSIAVTEVPNQAPQISSTPTTSISAGALYQYQVQASDADGDALQFSLLQAPAGATITSSGLLNWQTSDAHVGSHAFTLRATDSRGAYAEQSFVLAVQEVVNNPPLITSAPVTQARVGQPYAYTVAVEDPENDALTLTLPQAPAGMTMTAFGDISWTPSLAQLGSHPVQVRVSDGRNVVTQSFTVQVSDIADLDVSILVSNDVVAPNEVVTIRVSAPGAVNPAFTLTVNGNPLAVDAGGNTQFSAGDAGIYQLEAQVIGSDGATGSANTVIRVSVSGDNTPPIATITTPDDGALLYDGTAIVGTASDANLYRYRLLIAEADSSDFREFAAGTAVVTNGTLGTLDTSLLQNGLYTVLLVAEDINGLQSQDSTTIQIDGELKPGVVQLSFVDMTVPVAGIPITIERTYDSRVKSVRDLGVGWNLSIRQGEYKNNREPGRGWGVADSGGFFKIPCYTALEQANHVTDIRLSETESYQFRPRIHLSGYGSIISGGCLGQADFVQTRGVAGATLQVIGNNNVFYMNSTGIFTYDLGDDRFGDPWVPQHVRLTTPDGRVFDLNITSGITRMQDRNNNQLFISASGVVNSQGQGVSFLRDGQGRIEVVRNALGNEVRYGYDSIGNLVSFTNQLGEVTTYQYHPSPFDHHLRSITLPDGRVVSEFSYDADGRLSEVCDDDGCARAEYDLDGRTQTNYDATGRATTYVYDERGNVLSRTNALGHTTHYTYDDNDRLIQVVDPAGNITAREWDTNGNLLAVTEPYAAGEDPALVRTSFTYDTKGNLLTMTGPSGAQLANAYDTAGNLLSTTTETGFVLSQFSYDGSGRQLTETDPFGTINYNYKSNGLLNTLTDDAGVTTTFTHDAVGNPTGYTRNGLTANLAYDPMGRATTFNYSDGLSFAYSYDQLNDWGSAEGTTIPRVERTLTAKGLPAVTRQADGGEYRWEYDAAGRVTTEIDPLGHTTSYAYDAAGRLVGQTDALGNSTVYTLDTAGRLTALIDAEGNSTTYSYYGNGRRRTMVDPTGRQWQYEYTPTSASTLDGLGRRVTAHTNAQGLVTRVVNADGSERTWSYLVPSEALGGSDLPTRFTDEGGRVRDYGYDSYGRLTSATDFAGESATYTWGPNGLEAVSDAEGVGFTLGYNTIGRVANLSFSDGSGKTLSYDDRRNLSTVTLASGISKTLGYDLMGRLVSDVRSTGEQFAFTWDSTGRMLTASDSLGTAHYSYDAAGSVTRFESSGGESIAYTHDRVGRVENQTIRNASGSQQQESAYEYDDAGRLSRIVDVNGGETLMSYDAAGRLDSRTLPNGITTTFTYDDRDFVTGVEHRRSGAVISAAYYERNINGEPERISWQDGSYVLLAYDAAGRIVDERFHDDTGSLTRQVQYEYDRAGNRTAKVVDSARTNYAYGAGQRLLNTSGAESHSYGYDVDGRITSITRPGFTANLNYNFAGQIAHATVAGVAVDYRYDAAGRRIQASRGSVAQRYLRSESVTGQYENPQAVADQNGNLIQLYTYAGDTPLMRTDGAASRYYLTDAQGSVIAITDEAGNLVGSVKYDAYGMELETTGEMTVPAGLGGDFRFHGEWKDAVTGLYNLRARDYDPVTGRFLSADPAEPDYREPESLNRYLFANGNPYLFSDPSGRFTLISVNISLNIQATLRSIAVNIAKDYFIDKARSVMGSMVLGALKNFAALESFNPFGFAGVGTTAEAGRIWEQKIQNYICSLVPDTFREIVWFEPAVSGGYASANGYGCPGGGGTFAGAGSAKPDFILSKTEPRKLGRPPQTSIKAYLIGESKWRLKTFYNDYVLNRGGKRNQLRQIARFAADRVYARTAVFLALKDGTTSAEKTELSALLIREGVDEGAIPIMVSAQ